MKTITVNHKKKLKKTGLIGLLIAVTYLLCPSLSWSGPGTSSEFLSINPGARSAALAETFTAMHQDSEIVFYNPAGLTTLINPQLGASHMIWWEEVSASSIWGVQPLGRLGSVGWSILYLNVPSFNSTNVATSDSVQAWAGAVNLAYGYKIRREFAIGGQLGFATQVLDDQQAQSLSLDISGQYYLLNDQLTLALAIKKIGFSTAYIEQSDDVPMNFTLAAAYQFWPDDYYGLTISSELNQTLNEKLRSSLGLEGRLNRLYFVRMGLQSNADSGNWMTFGLGIKWNQFIVDYAVSPLSELGLTHQISLKFNFGSQRRLARPKIDMTLVHKQFVYADGNPGQEIYFIPKVEIAAGIKNWQLTIRNQKNVVIRQFHGNQDLPMKIVWAGLDQKLKRVNAEGFYRYTMRVVDKNNYTATKHGEILPISITKLPKLKALPRDIFAGRVSFKTSNKRPIKKWTITIVNNDGGVLKKYSGKGMIPKDFSWDGRDAANRQVALKTGHRFILSLTDVEDNEIKSVAPIVMVNAGTKAKTSEGVPLPEQVPFQFDFAAGSAIKGWALDIMDSSSGKVLRSVESQGPLPEQVFWDTRDDKGNIVPSDKTYSYVLRLQDPIGNIWRQAAALRETEVKILKHDKDGVTVKIEQILFDFNQAELKSDMHAKLKKTADIVREYQDKAVKVYVEGHTDDIGSEQYNLELSEQRAQMVMRYLVEEEALSSSLIIMKGYGKKQPIMRSNSKKARSFNRRVEITIVLPKNQ